MITYKTFLILIIYILTIIFGGNILNEKEISRLIRKGNNSQIFIYKDNKIISNKFLFFGLFFMIGL